MRLSAALIVRDEAVRISACLDSVLPLVDEIVVYDTGSGDDTRERAAAAGAIVIEGYWDDDFARARNAALAHCSGDWVLSADADEIFTGNRTLLLDCLRDAGRNGHLVLGVTATLTNPDQNGGDYQTRLPRVFRRTGALWSGRVHERIGHGSPSGPVPALDERALSFVHEGYSDAEATSAKAQRNLALGLREVEQLQHEDDPQRLAQALFDVGRSLVGMGLRSESLAPFGDVRTLSPIGSALWCQATDFLARQNLALGDNDRALEHAEQLLIAAPQHADYGRWLLAQALVQLGQFRTAADVLAPVEAVIDAAGRELAPARLKEFRALLSQLVAVNSGLSTVLG